MGLGDKPDLRALAIGFRDPSNGTFGEFLTSSRYSSFSWAMFR